METLVRVQRKPEVRNQNLKKWPRGSQIGSRLDGTNRSRGNNSVGASSPFA